MGFLTDPKTGKRMNVDQLISRERREWGDAFKIAAKELLVGADKSANRRLSRLDIDLDEIIRGHRRRKARR